MARTGARPRPLTLDVMLRADLVNQLCIYAAIKGFREVIGDLLLGQTIDLNPAANIGYWVINRIMNRHTSFQ